MQSERFRIPALALLTLLLLSACSSGGESSSTSAPGPFGTFAGAPPAPEVPTLSFGLGIKQLRFTWAEVSGAQYYRLFEDPDGFSGYSQIGGDLATTGYDHDIALYLRPTARYMLEACNAGGCTASSAVDVTGALVQAIGYFKASNTGNNDRFGVAVALSADGGTLAVGAYLENSKATGINGSEANGANNSGAVYVFTRTGSTWEQQAYVKASKTDATDFFGYAVALSSDGDTLAVGAYQENSNATGVDGDGTNNAANNAGAVYVFTRSASTWTQQAYVKAPNTGAGDRFGFSVALSGDGNTLAIGADQEESNATGIGGDQGNNAASNSGAVYLL